MTTKLRKSSKILELSMVQYQGYHTLQRIYHQQKLKIGQNGTGKYG